LLNARGRGITFAASHQSTVEQEFHVRPQTASRSTVIFRLHAGEISPGPKEVIRRYPAGKQASAVIPLLWRAQEQHRQLASRAGHPLHR
jgi:hypothetical protein